MFKRLDQVRRRDDAGTRDVDDKTVRPQGIQHLFVDQLPSPCTARCRDDKKVRGARQFDRACAISVRHITAGLAIVITHGHVKTQSGTFGDRHAHSTQPKNTEALAGQRRTHDFTPFATPHRCIGTRDITHQRQQQRQRVIGDRRRIDPGPVCHRNIPSLGGLKVDMLITGTDHADDFQMRQRGDFIRIKT